MSYKCINSFKTKSGIKYIYGEEIGSAEYDHLLTTKEQENFKKQNYEEESVAKDIPGGTDPDILCML